MIIKELKVSIYNITFVWVSNIFVRALKGVIKHKLMIHGIKNPPSFNVLITSGISEMNWKNISICANGKILTSTTWRYSPNLTSKRLQLLRKSIVVEDMVGNAVCARVSGTKVNNFRKEVLLMEIKVWEFVSLRRYLDIHIDMLILYLWLIQYFSQ